MTIEKDVKFVYTIYILFVEESHMQSIEDNRLMSAQPTNASVLSVCNHSENSYGMDAAFVASFFASFGMKLFYRFYNNARFYFYGYYGYRQLHRVPCKNRVAYMSSAA